MEKSSIKKFATIATAGVLALGLAACSSGNGSPGTSGDNGDSGDTSSETFTMRVSSTLSSSSDAHAKMEELADRLEEESDGRLMLEIYPDAQIGTTTESVQAIANGENVIAYTDSATLASLVEGDGKYLDILSGPFLFESTEEGLRFHEGEVYAEFVDALEEETEIKVLALNWLEGQRNMMGNKAYPEPEDMQNERVRVPPIETWTRTFDLIGAVPTTVEYSEVYSALEQGVVAATENGIPATLTSRYHEAVSELTLTRHFMPFYGFVMNQDVLAAMPEDVQEMLVNGFITSGEEFALANDELEAEALAELESHGVTVHEANIQAYKDITAPFYDVYPEGLVDRIRESAQE